MNHFFKNIFFVFTIAFAIIFISSCKKQPGQGGVASISGKVFADTVFYKKSLAILGMNQYMQGINVYLCYGTDSVPSDNVKTSYNGEFKFNYLQKGKYTVYVFGDNKDTAVFNISKPGTNFHPTYSVIVPIEITDRKQQANTGTIHINYGY